MLDPGDCQDQSSCDFVVLEGLEISFRYTDKDAPEKSKVYSFNVHHVVLILNVINVWCKLHIFSVGHTTNKSRNLIHK
jgi:hypothetical protein